MVPQTKPHGNRSCKTDHTSEHSTTVWWGFGRFPEKLTGDVTEGVGNEDHGTHDDSFGVSDDIGARGSEADTEGSDI